MELIEAIIVLLFYLFLKCLPLFFSIIHFFLVQPKIENYITQTDTAFCFMVGYLLILALSIELSITIVDPHEPQVGILLMFLQVLGFIFYVQGFRLYYRDKMKKQIN